MTQIILRVGLLLLPLFLLPLSSRTAAQSCVDINTASHADLLRIIHIGPERATEIIAKRPFDSVDDLIRVTSPSRLADIKREGLACVSSANPTPAPTVTSPATDRIAVHASSEYVRDEWPHWNDDDGDCQDARQEVLIAESRTPAVLDDAGCRVVSGWWIDSLSGQEFTNPSDMDVDHHVPLANAFHSGGWGWDRDTRTRYANYLADPWHLVAVSASVNRSKGDKGPDQWKPPQRSAWCNYAREWTMVKQRWLLTISDAEQSGLNEMLATCSQIAR